ncbi:MAG TPA: M14 family metallocarboxypeptidase [Chthoniobacterales bacterium]
MFPLHRCHDYPNLIRRWKSVARRAGLKIRMFSEIDGYPLFIAESPRIDMGEKGIYLSAGIHGDEAASTEGLIAWVENHSEMLQETHFTLLPCLNPWGLIHNCRFDRKGNDLNRSFHHNRVHGIRDLKKLLVGRRFLMSMALHEDYDAQGVYLYEIAQRASYYGLELLEAARSVIPIDPRYTVDGRRMSRPGYMRRTLKQGQLLPGPEALFLHLHHSDHTFTIETPSEFSLDMRIKAQQILIQAAVTIALRQEKA